MAYYPTAKSYIAAVLKASRDEDAYGDGERNALRGAYYTLLMQNGRVLEHQKRVGHHRADVKLEQQRYTVYVGAAPDGGMTVEVEHHPHNWTNEYYMSGDRPIRKVLKPEGGYDVWKYDWNTGQFVPGSEYGPALFFSRDVEEIGEDTFLAEVEALRQKVGASEQWRDVEPETADLLVELYALARSSSGEERYSLNRRTFALFEAVCRRHCQPYPESPRVMEAMNRIWSLKGNAADYPLPVPAAPFMFHDELTDTIKDRVHNRFPEDGARSLCLLYVLWEQIGEQLDQADGMNPAEPLIAYVESRHV
ncbi:hypothetical protein [Gorillibacterium sp. sgz5001074]|uniref:hypothetical protein n=1 Tax=Gorillibacterium sp. sgz5001074 TaxID=3446695 RepID=UPI003F666DF9